MVGEHERAAAETSAMVARASRLVAAELAAARVEVEAAAAADAARAAAAELKALRDSSTNSSSRRYTDDGESGSWAGEARAQAASAGERCAIGPQLRAPHLPRPWATDRAHACASEAAPRERKQALIAPPILLYSSRARASRRRGMAIAKSQNRMRIACRRAVPT